MITGTLLFINPGPFSANPPLSDPQIMQQERDVLLRHVAPDFA